MCVRMTSFVPDESQELTGPYTALKLFWTLTSPWKIGVFYLSAQKNAFNEINHVGVLWKF